MDSEVCMEMLSADRALSGCEDVLKTQSVLVEYFILIGSVHRCETEPTENSILLWDGYVSLLDEHGTE